MTQKELYVCRIVGQTKDSMWSCTSARVRTVLVETRSILLDVAIDLSMVKLKRYMDFFISTVDDIVCSLILSDQCANDSLNQLSTQ
jgi:hypothetical protein